MTDLIIKFNPTLTGGEDFNAEKAALIAVSTQIGTLQQEKFNARAAKFKAQEALRTAEQTLSTSRQKKTKADAYIAELRVRIAAALANPGPTEKEIDAAALDASNATRDEARTEAGDSLNTLTGILNPEKSPADILKALQQAKTDAEEAAADDKAVVEVYQAREDQAQEER